MIVLHFAHGAEAAQFIHGLDFKASSEGFYENENYGLLISGEGIQDTLLKLSQICERKEVTQIINLGIAGALREDLPLEEIFPIRTAYGHNETNPRFHSYTTNQKAELDCVSYENRVLDVQAQEKLVCFAPIVDRELWAVGKVAGYYKIPFKSFKLISDYAGKNTECLDIKNKAQSYSQKLLEFFLENKEAMAPNRQSPPEFELPFKVSFYNQKRYTKLVARLLKKKVYSDHQDILTDRNFIQIQDEEKNDKARANKIFAYLEEKLDPFSTTLNKNLDQVFSSFKANKIKFKIDPNLEKKIFSISHEINSEKNIQDLIRALNDFDFKELEKIWEGELNV